MFCVFAIPFAPTGVGFYFGSALPIIDIPRMLISSLIIAWLLKKSIRGEPFYLYWNSTTKFLILLVILQFITIFSAETYLIAFSQWFGYVTCYYMVFLILSDELKSSEDCKKTINVVVFLSICLALLSCYELIAQKGIYDNIRTAWSANPESHFEASIYRWENFNASKGPYGTTISLGFFFSLSYFLLIYKYLTEKRIAKKVLMLTDIIIVLFGLFFTQVRAAILVIMIVSLIPFLTRRKKGIAIRAYRFLFLILLLIGILLLPVVFPKSYFEYSFGEKLYYDSNYPEKNAFYGRLLGINQSANIILNEPLFGYGTGAVLKLEYVSPDLILPPTDLPIYIAFALESGIFASAAFILMIISSLFLLFRSYKKERNYNNKILLYYLFLSILSYSIVIWSSPRIDSSFTFFVLLAVSCCMGCNKKIVLKIA